MMTPEEAASRARHPAFNRDRSHQWPRDHVSFRHPSPGLEALSEEFLQHMNANIVRTELFGNWTVEPPDDQHPRRYYQGGKPTEHFAHENGCLADHIPDAGPCPGVSFGRL